MQLNCSICYYKLFQKKIIKNLFQKI